MILGMQAKKEDASDVITMLSLPVCWKKTNRIQI